MKCNKKGNVVSDVLMLLIVFFLISLIAIITHVSVSQINDDFQNDSEMNTIAKESLDESTTRYPKFFDGALLFFFILIWALVIVASFNLDNNPIFFIFSLILFVFIIGVVITVGNAFHEITTDVDITSSALQFPITLWIFDHLLPISITIASSVLIVLFGKMRNG